VDRNAVSGREARVYRGGQDLRRSERQDVRARRPADAHALAREENPASAQISLPQENPVRISIGLGMLTVRVAKERKTGTKYAQRCHRIREGNLTRLDVVELLKKEGFTPGSAASTATYLMNLSKPENAKVLEGVCSGKVTVANARTELAKKQSNPARSDKERLSTVLEKATKQAVQLGYKRQSFIDDCIADIFFVLISSLRFAPLWYIRSKAK